jgi:hypothetical protein
MFQSSRVGKNKHFLGWDRRTDLGGGGKGGGGEGGGGEERREEEEI